MGDQELGVAQLDLLARGEVGEVNHRPVQLERGGDQHMLSAPLGGHWFRGEVRCRLGAEALDMPLLRSEIGAEVGENLPQRGLGLLSQV